MGRVFWVGIACVVAGQALAQAPVVAPSGPSSPKYPFIGKWDCEVATFTFTDKIYNNGSENMPIRKIVATGKNEYRLEFAKGYRIMLQITGPQKMNWLSGESGDGFTCKRTR